MCAFGESVPGWIHNKESVRNISQQIDIGSVSFVDAGGRDKANGVECVPQKQYVMAICELVE